MTILLVDDYPDTLHVLCEGLEDAGFTVVKALDGERAIELFVRQPSRFTAVVADVMLPGKAHGSHVASVARSFRSNIPIVVMSGLPIALMPFFQGMVDCHVLEKPFRISRLLSLLSEPSALPAAERCSATAGCP